MRSMTLPTAPPSTSDKPADKTTRPSRRMRHNQTTMTQLTIMPRTMKNQRCQPDEFARKLNAAPVLRWCVILIKELTGTLSYSSTHLMITHFVN